MIIGAAISIILGIIGVISCILFADDPAYETAWPLFIASAILAVVTGILQLIAGIVGLKNSSRPEKAAVCIILGVIVLAANIADQFFSNFVSGLKFFLMIFRIALLIPADLTFFQQISP